jgi:hypothetical protein
MLQAHGVFPWACCVLGHFVKLFAPFWVARPESSKGVAGALRHALRRLRACHPTTLLVGLGIALRLFHYLRDPSVWHDEAALIVNVLRHNFAELLGPLMWNEAAPPLFLWLERAVVLIFGDSTLALRLIPFLGSCVSLLLLAAVAVRRLPARGAFWAVLLVAVSDCLLWHACEAKPYAVDAALAALVLFAFDRTAHWRMSRRLVGLIFLTPFAIFLSYPACFLLGGLWLALALTVFRGAASLPRKLGVPESRRYVSMLARDWHPQLTREARPQGSPAAKFPLLAWSVVLGVSFLLLYFGPIRAQRTGPMEGCWITQFPDWSRPWSVPLWCVQSSLDVLRYDFKPVGFVLAGLLTVGTVVSWRRDRTWFVVLLAPLALAWVAALIGGYPFGGSRLEVFGLPALALLIGAGIEPIRKWCGRYVYMLLVVPLLLIPAGWTAYWVVVPWPRIDAAGASRFIYERSMAGEPVVANHWEYVYYFRDRPQDLLLDAPLPQAPRVWVTVTAQDDAEREEIIANYGRQGRVVERRDFTFTVVLLLEPFLHGVR